MIEDGFTGDPQADIDSIIVTDPGGGTIATLGDFEYLERWRDFFAQIPGSPDIGTFTATVTSGSLSGTATDIHSTSRAIPVPDTATMSPATGTTVTSKTPLFSWAPVDYNETTMYYRLTIYNMSDERVWASDWEREWYSCVVPDGILVPGEQYQWRIRATDSSEWEDVQNRSNSEWLTFTMDAVPHHSAMPALDPDGWGAVYGATAEYNWVDLWVKVVDHDGVAYDGSSHVVTATFPDSTVYQLELDSSDDGYYFGVGLEEPMAPGDYPITFTVTDPDGNIATFVDTMTVIALSPPNENTLTPSNQYPIQQHITASFDDVYVNGVLYEDFDVASFGELDQGNWEYVDYDDVYIQDQMLKITRNNCPGPCDSFLQFTAPASVNTIQAKIAIDSVSSHAPVAGIEGVFYNNGNHDVYANIMISKNEFDENHVVRYHVFELIISDDFISMNSLAEGELMTVSPGTAVTASIDWDGADFTFDADGNTDVYTSVGDINPVEDPQGRGKKLVIDLPVKTDDTSPTLTWDPVPNANHYRVRIFNTYDNSQIWKGHYAAETSYTVPPGVLLPNTGYTYQIEARESNSPLDVDNRSQAPLSRSDFSFWTGEESPDPFIEFDSSGVQTWNNSYTGPYLSFWIKVHDPQGVPSNIETVKVTFPGGSAEEILYLNSVSSSTSGYYSSDSFLPIEDGIYTFTVIDKDGNESTKTEDFTSNPIGYPDETLMSPVPFTLVNDTAVEFDWEDVPGVTFYRVEIYDIDYNRIYRFATTESYYSLPAGFLAEGTLYRYRITTRREFFSDNIDNGSTSPWNNSVMFTFMTTPVAGGVNAPMIDPGDLGVSVVHVYNPGTEASEYLLQFDVNIIDLDGVPENIESVRVTYPDTITTLDLFVWDRISSSEGSFWNMERYDDPGNIPQGTYTIRVTDFDGNWVELTDDLIVNELPMPTNVTPVQDSTVPNITPLIDWDDVPDATR
ncbi:MAG: hypothetical protein DRI98_12050 [Bacteroidetes bacterium]|nr:MAG: hypothetical protein DRI98_12050 [Bacteroidota bacterium]